MPIRPDLRHLYRGPGYRAQRVRIIARAGNRCEQCGKPNGRLVWVYRSKTSRQCWTLSLRTQRWVYCRFGGSGNFSLLRSEVRALRSEKRLRRIRVVLTMAHLDHDAANGDDDNIRLLCQWCHLNYDKLHHKETRAMRKDAARPLLREALT